MRYETLRTSLAFVLALSACDGGTPKGLEGSAEGVAGMSDDEKKNLPKAEGSRIRGTGGPISVGGATHASRSGLEARAAAANARGGARAIMLVDGPLPGGGAAIVKLGSRHRFQRFVIVSREQLDEHLLTTALGVPFNFYMKHPEDAGEVTVTLFADGRFVEESVSGGRVEGRFPQMGSARSGAMVEGLLKAAESIPETEVPGVGRARVVRAIGVE